MKKFLFFALTAFVSITMNAQVVTSTSFRKVKAKSGTVWYVKAGTNISNFSVSGGDNPSAIIGYNVGIAFDRPIGNGGMFWNSGLQLATKGAKFGDDKLNANKLEIPVTLGYKYQLNDDVALDARIGGFANYDVFGTYYDGYHDESYSLGDYDYDRFSAGMQFGVGIWYQKLNFNVTYQNGLVKIGDCKERNWMFSLGYAF